MLVPAAAYYLIFQIMPYYGLVIAFKDFNPVQGISGSPWVGLKHVRGLIDNPDFGRLMRNTVLISLFKLIVGFPVPVVFALLLNEVRRSWFKRSVQTITSFPYFLSWVVYGGIVSSFLTPTGVINSVIQTFDGSVVNFLANSGMFRPIVIITDAMKNFGWGSIIYLAAIAGINPDLYDVARVDGAGRWKQLLHVTLPGLMSTLLLMFIISLSHILDAGFEQVYVLLNPAVYSVGDIIDTYVYRVGLEKGQFSVATLVGLCKGAIGFVLIIGANALLRRTSDKSIW